MFTKKSALSFAIGALGSAAGMAITLSAQAENKPFSAQTLQSGYVLAEAKMPEGKCGEGKCGGKKSGAADKMDKSSKTDKNAKAAKGTEKKMAEGKCGGKMKADAKETPAPSK